MDFETLKLNLGFSVKLNRRFDMTNIRAGVPGDDIVNKQAILAPLGYAFLGARNKGRKKKGAQNGVLQDTLAKFKSLGQGDPESHADLSILQEIKNSKEGSAFYAKVVVKPND